VTTPVVAARLAHATMVLVRATMVELARVVPVVARQRCAQQVPPTGARMQHAQARRQ